MTREELAARWPKYIERDVIDNESQSRYTFYGIYDTYYNSFQRTVRSEKTQFQRNDMLNNNILPNLRGHDIKSIDQYTREDFENCIRRIIDRGQISAKNKGKRVKYADSTVQQMRNIIADIESAAANYGECEDVLADTYFKLDTKEYTDTVLLTKKSIPYNTASTMINSLMSRVNADGEDIGFLLVVACGLRINECTAVNFGNILEMKYHPGNYKLRVFESTQRNSKQLKTSGKTQNADRYVPLYDRVADFVLKRKEYVADCLKNSGIDADIDGLPIACRGGDYFTRCTTKQISDRAREIMIKHRIDSKVLACIDMEMYSGNLCSTREKNPTGYLGRHLFATWLAFLNLDASQIQAVIGHDIEDSGESRNEFASEDKLYVIKQKMDRMPLYRLGPPDGILVSGCRNGVSGTGSLMLCIDEDIASLTITAETEEPSDTLHISSSYSGDATIITTIKNPDYTHGIDTASIIGKIKG